MPAKESKKINLSEYDIKFISYKENKIRMEVGENPYNLKTIDLVEVVDSITVNGYNLSVHYKPYFESHPLSTSDLEILKVKHKPLNTNFKCPLCKSKFSMSIYCENEEQFKYDLASHTRIRRLYEMNKTLGKN